MSFKSVIIGGGAAGMAAAIMCKRNNIDVAIIDHKDKLGIKILKTGNGKCNFANTNVSRECFNSDSDNDKSFIMNILSDFSTQDTIDFFKGIGVYPKDKAGYLYPRSETAASIADALISEVNKLEIPVYLECDIKSIDYSGEKYTFSFWKSDKKINTETILFACGAKASPKSGSDGSGFKLINDLGIKIINPLPALTALVSDNKNMKLASGVRTTGQADVYVNGKLEASDIGEIQFTDYGLSGIPIFQISRFAVKGISDGKDVKVKLNLLHDLSDKDIEDIIASVLERKDETFAESLSGVLNKKLVTMVLKNNNIDASKKLCDIEKNVVESIILTFKNLEYQISGYNGFDYAQVCQGGVSIDELDSNLMSINNPGVFFAGEVIDVDGKCGGYNLLWAWSSASKASKGIELYINRT